ncbi:MAG: class II fumarate hydratase, partial [Alcanivorax sp.]|nr:class II fumarate hydratase [Alcanivorax sp.]
MAGSDKKTRTEADSLGPVEIPLAALWGAQTQRALDNFSIDKPLPNRLIRAIALIKLCAARANAELGLLDADKASAITTAAEAIVAGEHADQFPVDIYQTGSGTSSNMNVNEVIAHLCARAGVDVHPNDDVNLGQSSNDTIPSAIHLSAVQALEPLQASIRQLRSAIQTRAAELADVVKPGRTHLMDAMPVTFGQVLGGWDSQLEHAGEKLRGAGHALQRLPQGGTAVGTGVNCHADFAARFCFHLSESTGMHFQPLDSFFAGQGAIDRPLALSAALRGYAIVVGKIANDLRWMNSGPLHGLGEISLPALQPGSSIMPGKVNPVVCESTLMVCAQVQGLDQAICLAAQQGNFELNVMLPLVANNLLEMIRLLSRSNCFLADKAIA